MATDNRVKKLKPLGDFQYSVRTYPSTRREDGLQDHYDVVFSHLAKPEEQVYLNIPAEISTGIFTDPDKALTICAAYEAFVAFMRLKQPDQEDKAEIRQRLEKLIRKLGIWVDIKGE